MGLTMYQKSWRLRKELMKTQDHISLPDLRHKIAIYIGGNQRTLKEYTKFMLEIGFLTDIGGGRFKINGKL